MRTKSIVIYSLAALVVGLIISPFIGMAIGSTREFILGLAPEEAVLQLADKIDENRASADQKTTELQSLIDIQRGQIAEQQSIIDSQKAELDNQKASVSQIASDVSNEQNCRKAQELFAIVPDNKDGSCRVLGPTNIIQAYEKAQKYLEDANNGEFSDKEASIKCSKKYLEIVKPIYNQYLNAKGLCKR